MRARDVVVLFVDSVSRSHFQSAFRQTTELLRRVNHTATARVHNFVMAHSLPCCTKNWFYPAMSGLYAPSAAGRHSPVHAARTPWVWDHFAARGFVTHVSNDACYPSELQDWWRSEDAPLPPNVSDHPMLDTFCKRWPARGADGEAWLESRTDGAQYSAALDRGESICLAGETLARRHLAQALGVLRAYPSAPKFVYAALNDANCRCASGAAHLDVEVARLIAEIGPRLSRTVLIIVSGHGLRSADGFHPSLHLPLVTVVTPRRMLAELPSAAAALRRNQRRLVSPFDVHATLRHLGALGGKAPAAAAAEPPPHPEVARLWDSYRDAFEANSMLSPLKYAPVPAGGPLGRSLLVDLPDDRSCGQAGIPDAVCRLRDAREISLLARRARRPRGPV